MGKKKYPKHVILQLAELIKALPAMRLEAYDIQADGKDRFVPVIARITGDRILSIKADSKDSENNPINKEKNYDVTLKTFHYANHKKRIYKAYDEKGWAGVDEYIKLVKSKTSIFIPDTKPAEFHKEQGKKLDENKSTT